MNIDWPIQHFEEIDSTNLEAKRQAATPGFHNKWILADSQTAGRGRMARSWVSEPGNLYVTGVFTEQAGLPVAMRLPFAAALVVRDVIASAAPDVDVKLKWPNDVRIEGRKISGILIETGQVAGSTWIAVGMGLNLVSAPDVPDKPATYGKQLDPNGNWDRDYIFGVLAERFQVRLKQARAGFADLRAEWLQHAEGMGQTIRVNLPDRSIDGVFEDMNASGAIILRLPTGEQQLISSGDVNLVGGV